MKIARIIAPFSLSALVFVLSYLSSLDIRSGYFPMILLGIGIFMAAIGTLVLVRD